MSYLAEAIQELRPDSAFMIREDSLIWLDDPSLKPTDTEIQQKIIDISLKYAKQDKLDEIMASFEKEVRLLIGNATIDEMVSWYSQEIEAINYKKDPTYPTPFIDNLLLARNLGEDKDALADKIITKATAFKTYYAQLLGKRQRLEYLVEQATDLLTVEAIVW